MTLRGKELGLHGSPTYPLTSHLWHLPFAGVMPTLTHSLDLALLSQPLCLSSGQEERKELLKIANFSHCTISSSLYSISDQIVTVPTHPKNKASQVHFPDSITATRALTTRKPSQMLASGIHHWAAAFSVISGCIIHSTPREILCNAQLALLASVFFPVPPSTHITNPLSAAEDSDVPLQPGLV